MFETKAVLASEYQSGDIIGIRFSLFFNVKVCCVFSLESPHRGTFTEIMRLPKEEPIRRGIFLRNTDLRTFNKLPVYTGWRPVMAVFYYTFVSCNRNIVSSDSTV